MKTKQIVAIAIVIVIIAIVILVYLNRNSTSEECEAPGIPQNVRAVTNSEYKITVIWDKVPNAVKYKVFRYNQDPLSGASPSESYETSGLTFAFKDVTDHQNWIRVKSIKKCGENNEESEFSETITQSLECSIEIDPEDLDAEYCEGPHCDLPTGVKTLSWNKIPGVKSYGIFISSGGYDRQLMISEDGTARKTITLPDVNSINFIAMVAVSGCGQSNMVIVYS